MLYRPSKICRFATGLALPLLAALPAGCADRSSSTPATAAPAPRPTRLRILASPHGSSHQRLHWTPPAPASNANNPAAATRHEVHAYQVFRTANRLPAEWDRSRLVGTVFGGVTSLPVSVQNNTGDQIFAVQAIYPDGRRSPVSEPLILKTLARLAFRTAASDRTSSHLWLAALPFPDALGPGQDVRDFAWSPRGDRLAILTGPQRALLVDGIDARAPGVPQQVTAMAWSPAGDALAFVSRGRLWLWQPQKPVQALTAPVDGKVLDFAWSPDAARLAVILRSNFGATDSLKLVPAFAGSARTLLSKSPQRQGMVSLAWSPLADALLLKCTNPQNQWQVLWRVDVAARRLPIAIADRRIDAYGWSPDGTAIAVVSDMLSPGTPQLLRVDPGGRRRMVLNDKLGKQQTVHSFAWSCDGTLIAYTTVDAQAKTETLHAVELSSPTPARLFRSDVGSHIVDLRWSPVARQLLFRQSDAKSGNNPPPTFARYRGPGDLVGPIPAQKQPKGSFSSVRRAAYLATLGEPLRKNRFLIDFRIERLSSALQVEDTRFTDDGRLLGIQAWAQRPNDAGLLLSVVPTRRNGTLLIRHDEGKYGAAVQFAWSPLVGRVRTGN